MLAPSAGILGDTPLGRGEWVGGTQPLNYDASDNVGVRTADAIVAGQTGGSHQRPCAFASPEGTFADRVPCPNGPGQHQRRHDGASPRARRRSSSRPRTPPATSATRRR